MAVNKNNELSESELEYANYIDNISKDNTDQSVPWYKSYPNAAIRGAAAAINQLPQIVDPFTGENRGVNLESVKKNYPIGKDIGPQRLESAVQGGLETIPFLPLGGGSGMAIKGALGGLASQGVKELGGSETLQEAAKIGTQFIPSFEKKLTNILPTVAGRAERELIRQGTNLGLSEDALALTLEQKGPVKDLIKGIAAKGGRLINRFQNARNELSKLWERLRISPDALKELDGEGTSRLFNNMSHRLSRLPSEQRERIMVDYNDLVQSKMRGQDIIDFWQKLNYYIPKGDAALGVLKEDLTQALRKISPNLERDFTSTNKLYGNFIRNAELAGPDIAESLIRAGERGIVISALTTGKLDKLKLVLGPIGARQLATEMSSNPRFMNLSSKFIESTIRGTPFAVKKSFEALTNEVRKKNKALAEKMSQMSYDDYVDLIEISQKEDQSDKK
jgi:hypothetical protein